MNKNLRLLVTNDDGIYAPGLLFLLRELAKLGEVVAIAPERPRSASGHAITLHKPLRINPVHLPGGEIAYATNGTPSDCVVLGMSDLVGKPPHLVVSGINVGGNLGEDLTYSGTVSAAMEAAIFGVPSFAISVVAEEDPDLAPAARFAFKLARQILRHGLPKDTFLNVNVPATNARRVLPVEVTRQGRRRYEGRLEKRVDLRGLPYYWLGGELCETGPSPGTDVEAVKRGHISLTPIQLDLTDHSFLEQLRGWKL